MEEWNNTPTLEQKEIAREWKKEREKKGLANSIEEEARLRKRASELEFDEPEAKQPVTSDNATVSKPSSLEEFLKKTRLHDPQSAADLLNRQNKPYKPGIQLGGDDEEEVEEEPLMRGGFSSMSALNKRLIDYNKNKSGSAILEKKAEEEEKRKQLNLMADRQRAETFDADPDDINSAQSDINKALANVDKQSIREDARTRFMGAQDDGATISELKQISDEINNAPRVEPKIEDDKDSGLMNIKKSEVINQQAQKQINKKIKEPKKKVAEKAPYAPELEQQISSIVNPMSTPEGVNDEASIMADVESSLKLLNNAKTEEEKEKIIKKVEDKATTPEEKKHLRAMTKEQGPDRYYVDPLTGYALNVSKVARRKGAMQIANMLPAADRATFLYSKGIIDKPDFDALMGPGTRASLDLQLKKLQIREAGFKVTSAKAKAEKDPKRAEYLSMFINAGSTDNYVLQAYLGGKLGLDPKILSDAKKAQRLADLAKLSAKGSGSKDVFKNKFFTPYSNVVDDTIGWADKATAIIQQEGQVTAYEDLFGKTIRDRSGRFRAYGLKEYDDFVGLGQKQQFEILKRSPYWNSPKLGKNKEFLDSKGNFDPSKLTANKDAYERYLMDDLIFKGMDTAYQGQYREILRFIKDNSYNYEREQAKLKKTLTSTNFSGDPALNNQ